MKNDILSALASNQAEIRWAAALTLERHSDEEWALEELEKLVGDQDPYISSIAARALVEAGRTGHQTSLISDEKANQDAPVETLERLDGTQKALVIERLTELLAAPSSRGKAPIPQANSVDRILQVSRIATGDIRPSRISELSGISSRQVDYYINAAIWMGLSKNDFGIFRYLGNELGVENPDPLERHLAVSRLLVQSHDVVRFGLKYFLMSGELPQIVDFEKELLSMLNSEFGQSLRRISGSTNGRRLDTARAWLVWVVRPLAEGHSDAMRTPKNRKSR